MTEQTNTELIAEVRDWTERDADGAPQNLRRLALKLASALEASEKQVKEAVSQRNRAYRQRDEEREAKEGNVRALNRVARDRDEYAAVVEKVRGRLYQPIHPYGDRRIPEVPEHEFLADGYGEALPRDLFDILATAPTDALRERDAEKWDEGYGDCWTYHQSHGLKGREKNPYRAREERA